MSNIRSSLTALLTFALIVGLLVAPVGTVAAQDEGGEFPEEICTDLLELLHQEIPYDQIIWVNDLPNEAQPPGVPWSVVTPRAIGGIVVGATPNQCDVQDPNDPSWDPREDDLDPDGDAGVEEGEDGKTLVIFNGTLDQSSDGPSVEGQLGGAPGADGELDPALTANDGEKDYALDPRLAYWEDGTTYFETDVYVFQRTLGVEKDCFGEECNFATRGLPNFVEYPAFPSHTDRERPDSEEPEEPEEPEEEPEADEDDDTDDGGDSGPSSDGGGSDDTDDGPSTDDGGGADADAETDDEPEETETPEPTETETPEETEEPTETETPEQAGDGADGVASAATEEPDDGASASGSGTGVVVAIVFGLLASLVGAWRT